MIQLRPYLLILLVLALLQSASSFQASFTVSKATFHYYHRIAGRANRAAVGYLHQAPQTDIYEDEKPYFLRRALMADLSSAARILADGFYDDRNAASKWWERLQTEMSLESNLPTFKNVEHEMWVACQRSDGKVLAFCEVDNRKKDFLNDTRPYMCNLAVHLDHRGQGLAQEMIRQCEDSADLWDQDKLFLKVRENNDPAVKLYSKMGYDVVATQVDEKTQDTLLVMKRAWEWKSIVANSTGEEDKASITN